MELTPQEAAALLERGDVVLVDVREDGEHAEGRIPGDRHVPLGQVAAEAETLDRDRPVVFYCRSGVRSLMAAQAFAGAGFEAYSLAGGLLAWEAAGLRFEGRVADH